MKILAIPLALSLLPLAAQPQAPSALLKSSGDFQWKPSTSLPPGAEYQLIREDPSTRGIEAIVRFPPGYRVPAHSHAAEETLVVLKGKLEVKTDAGAKVLHAGDYAVFPAGVSHELAVKGFGEALMVAVTNAPFDVKGLGKAP